MRSLLCYFIFLPFRGAQVGAPGGSSVRQIALSGLKVLSFVKLGNQLIDALEHILLVSEAVTRALEFFDLTVDAFDRTV